MPDSPLVDLGGAFALLTIIPVPRRFWFGEGWQAGRAMAWFPLIGWVVGGLVAAVWLLARSALPDAVAAALALAAWVVITGGLHLDGLIDCCDALCATIPPDRRLEILKDPRAGSFGVLGGGLVLILKFAAISSLGTSAPPGAAPVAALPLLIAPVLARALVLYPMLRYPAASSSRMGNQYRAGFNRRGLLLSLVWLCPTLLAGPRLVAAGVGGLLGAVGFAAWAAPRLGGGLTGDVYGATCEICEVLCLICLLAR
jgi:adenosylcobinamide-GDP ribazoletransferase